MNRTYTEGFAAGEAEAWRMRAYPLPEREPAATEWDRGFNDGRFPRSHSWSIRQRIPQTWREAA